MEIRGVLFCAVVAGTLAMKICAREPLRESTHVVELGRAGAVSKTVASASIVVCLDVSHSMNALAGGEVKLAAGQRAAGRMLEVIERYAALYPEREVAVGLCTFAEHASMTASFGGVQTGGNTAIGEAIELATRVLVATPATKRAIVVVTDGENNSGVRPEEVIAALAANRNDRGAHTADIEVSVVAFDVAASVFEGVRAAGADVLEAGDARALELVVVNLIDEILLERT